MLWRGGVKDPRSWNCTSYKVEVAGVQGQTLHDFARQTKIRNFRLENVPTFQLDASNPEEARAAWAISAKMSLRCESTPRGRYTCSETNKRYNKFIYLHPSPLNWMKVVRFESWGDIIMTPKFEEWTREMSNHTPVNLSIPIVMIPYSNIGEIPISYQNPLAPAPDSSRFDFSAENLEVFPTAKNTTAKIMVNYEPDDHPDQRSPNSSIHAGIVLSHASGGLNVISRQTENRPIPMGPFGPLAASTSEEPTNRQPGPLSLRPQTLEHDIPSREDLLAAGPSGLQSRSPTTSRSPTVSRPTTPRSPRRSPRLSNTVTTQTNEPRKRTRSHSPRPTKRVRYFERPHNTRKKRWSPRKSSSKSPSKSPGKSPSKTPTSSPPKASPPKSTTPSVDNSNLLNLSTLLNTPDSSRQSSTQGRNLGRLLSVPSHDEEASIIFIEEIVKKAQANNSKNDPDRPVVDVSAIENGTLPVFAGKKWKDDPNPTEMDLLPEHVAIYIELSSNTVLRTVYFWEQCDIWAIVQAIVNDDVIIKSRPRQTLNETDMLIDSSLMRLANESYRTPRADARLDSPIPGTSTTSSTEATRGSSAETSTGNLTTSTSDADSSSTIILSSSTEANTSSTVILSSSGQSSDNMSNLLNEGQVAINQLLGSSASDSSNTLAESNNPRPQGGGEGGEGGHA